MIALCLTSCGTDTTQLAKDEFSKYYNGKDEVVLVIDDTIYMEKNELNLNALVKDNEPNGGLIIRRNTLLFSTSEQNSMFDFILNIYETDFLGTEIKLVFSKNEFKTNPHVYATGDSFYIEHYLNPLDEKSKHIDKYTISTGNYENINKGKDCNLSNYMVKEISNYEYSVIENESPKKHGCFKIKDKITNAERIIDDQFLTNTIYIESLQKFNYSPKRVDISKGHILLTYGIGAGNGWNYSHLVFEYDFNSNALEYKLLAFPYDNVPIIIKIIYIN